MLFLNDSSDPDLAPFLQFPGSLVPPGHVFTTAGSPGSPNMQNQLLALKVGNRNRFAIYQRGQQNQGKSLSNFQCQNISGCACFEVGAQKKQRYNPNSAARPKDRPHILERGYHNLQTASPPVIVQVFRNQIGNVFQLLPNSLHSTRPTRSQVFDSGN